MSRETLVNEYVAGRISRRTLIRRLVAAGVGFGAAVSYAHVLSPERSRGSAFRDEYGFVNVNGRLIDQDLDRVIADEKVKVRLTTGRRAQVEFRIWLRRPERETGGYALIGQRTKIFDGAVRNKTVSIPLAVNPPSSVDALEPLQSAPLDLVTVARRIRHPKWGSSFHQRTLDR